MRLLRLNRMQCWVLVAACSGLLWSERGLLSAQTQLSLLIYQQVLLLSDLAPALSLGAEHIASRNLPHPLPARLFEPVPLERADAAEELVVGAAVLLGLVLDGGKLDGAQVVSHLLQAVVSRWYLEWPRLPPDSSAKMLSSRSKPATS